MNLLSQEVDRHYNYRAQDAPLDSRDEAPRALADHRFRDGEALIGYHIREGQYGKTRLDGLRFAKVVSWPGAIHEGNGTMLTVIDEKTTPEQRAALMAIDTGKEGGPYFEILSAVCPTQLETVFKPITFEVDRKERQARLEIPGIGETRTEPIKNPVTGEEHRARIVLPNGFEYKEAEMGNAVAIRVEAGGVAFRYENTYSQLNVFDWTNA